MVQLDPALEVAVGRSERALARSRQIVGRVDTLDRAFLELDRVAPRRDRRCDEFFRQIDIAVVIDPDLGDCKDRLAGSDHALADANRVHLASILPSRTVSRLQPSGESTPWSDILPARPRRALLVAWALMAILNLSAGLVITSWPERQGDLDMIEGWGQQWLVAGMNLYATDAMPKYPPHAVVALSPLGILSHIWAVRVWTILNLCLAVVAPVLAVRIVRPLAAWPAIALPILMFLCWGGFRTLLQFSLVTLVFGLLSMKLADRRPAWSGVCLG